MSVFLDTSALLAVLDADDEFHPRARDRQLNLKTAFAFDRDFSTQEFETPPVPRPRNSPYGSASFRRTGSDASAGGAPM